MPRKLLFGLLFLPLLSAATSCRTGATSPDQRPLVNSINSMDPTQQSPEECKRRAIAMAEQDKAIRNDPDPGTFQGWENPNKEWGEEVDPCPEPGATSRRDPRQDEEIIALTQTRAALASDDYVLARQTVTRAYVESGDVDGLRELTREVALGHTPLLQEQHRTSGKLGHRGGDPVCVFIPAASQPEADPGKVQELFEGETQIDVVCGIPNLSPEHLVRTAELRVRRRLGAGQFQDVARQEIGTLDSLRAGAEVRARIDLSTLPSSQDHAYLEAFLVATKPGHSASELARGAAFWFREPGPQGAPLTSP